MTKNAEDPSRQPETLASPPQQERSCTPAVLSARELILQRRNRFVAAALAGLSGLSGCEQGDSPTPQVCLQPPIGGVGAAGGAPSNIGGAPGAGAGGTPMQDEPLDAALDEPPAGPEVAARDAGPGGADAGPTKDAGATGGAGGTDGAEGRRDASLPMPCLTPPALELEPDAGEGDPNAG